MARVCKNQPCKAILSVVQCLIDTLGARHRRQGIDNDYKDEEDQLTLVMGQGHPHIKPAIVTPTPCRCRNQRKHRSRNFFKTEQLKGLDKTGKRACQ